MTKCIKVYWNKEAFERSYIKPDDYNYFKVFLYEESEEKEILEHMPSHFFYKIDFLSNYDLKTRRESNKLKL